jgi:hypothetical protein
VVNLLHVAAAGGGILLATMLGKKKKAAPPAPTHDAPAAPAEPAKTPDIPTPVAHYLQTQSLALAQQKIAAGVPADQAASQAADAAVTSYNATAQMANQTSGPIIGLNDSRLVTSTAQQTPIGTSGMPDDVKASLIGSGWVLVQSPMGEMLRPPQV